MTADRERQALAWYERLKTDRSGETRAAFESWLAADPENAREFEQQGKLDAAIRAAGLRGVEPATPGFKTRQAWLPIALGAGALAAAALAAVLAWPGGGKTIPQPPMATIAAAPELVQVRTLADGSIAIVSPGAELRGGAAGGARGATLLTGSARFLVAHDPSRPFVVRADGLTVVARGTVFDVDLGRSGGRVTLIEGRVDVRREGAAERVFVVTLAPGERIDAATFKASAPAAPELRRVAVVDADGLALSDLLRIVNAQSAARLGLGDPSLATRKVTGRFDVGDVRALAERLAAALDLVLVEQGGQLILAPK